MTTTVDIVNRGLQALGTRTTVTSAELANQTSNEAIQANLILLPRRDELLRMAPWNCATNYAVLNYISSVPGTPENTSQGTPIWQKGMPPPPWAYEYQYPVDCERPLWIIPQFITGQSQGIPITTAVTGGAPAFWNGPPVRFKVAIDQFFPVTAATVNNPGTGYVVGEIITLASGPITSMPIGAPVKLQVASIGGGGAVGSVTVVNQIAGSATPQGGSYFAVQPNPVAQGSTTGVGINASFNLTFGPQGDQRIILTNQEFATLTYIKQVTDPNVMDPLFIDAWSAILGAGLVMALTGDKTLANVKVAEANSKIAEARKADGNEGLTINDVTPDFIRIRGIDFPNWDFGPNMQYDWGPMFTPY